MRYAVLSAIPGIVENLIEAEPGFDHPQGRPLAAASETVSIGDAFDGSAFTAAASASLPSAEDLIRYLDEMQAVNFAKVRTFDVGTTEAPKVVTTGLAAAGVSAVTVAGFWAILNATSTTALKPWSNADGSSAQLSPVEALQLARHADDVNSRSFAVYNAARDAIGAVPPAITSRAAIDALGWPE